ncbi:proteoglycan 4-like [Cydia strobilella]|uniref:proteoglycan 4-like n=1 Tax=Cydia strobilella TaxID=1100964 RepID=UPI003004467E
MDIEVPDAGEEIPLPPGGPYSLFPPGYPAPPSGTGEFFPLPPGFAPDSIEGSEEYEDAGNTAGEAPASRTASPAPAGPAVLEEASEAADQLLPTPTTRPFSPVSPAAPFETPMDQLQNDTIVVAHMMETDLGSAGLKAWMAAYVRLTSHQLGIETELHPEDAHFLEFLRNHPEALRPPKRPRESPQDSQEPTKRPCNKITPPRDPRLRRRRSRGATAATGSPPSQEEPQPQRPKKKRQKQPPKLQEPTTTPATTESQPREKAQGLTQEKPSLPSSQQAASEETATMIQDSTPEPPPSSSTEKKTPTYAATASQPTQRKPEDAPAAQQQTQQTPPKKKNKYPSIVAPVLPNWAAMTRKIATKLGQAVNAKPVGRGLRFEPRSEEEYKAVYDHLDQLENDDVEWIEAWRGKSGPPQCHRCQGFRHHSKGCHRPQKCVRCAGSQCPRPKEEPCTCANCAGPHSANYRRCPVYVREARNWKAGTNAHTIPKKAGPVTKASIVKPTVEESAPASLMAPANAPTQRGTSQPTVAKPTKKKKKKKTPIPTTDATAKAPPPTAAPTQATGGEELAAMIVALFEAAVNHGPEAIRYALKSTLKPRQVQS